MTDNQLLFEAAKAAGIDYTLRGQVPTQFDGKDFIVWNPLKHDGDALRLAVKLGFMDSGVGFAAYLSELQQMIFPANVDPDRPYAATRRAIVRAAAKIGRNMK